MHQRRGKKRDCERKRKEEAVGPRTRVRYNLALVRFSIFFHFFALSIGAVFDDSDLTRFLLSRLFSVSLRAEPPNVLGSGLYQRRVGSATELSALFRIWSEYFSAWRRIEPPVRARPIALLVLQILLGKSFHTSIGAKFSRNSRSVYLYISHLSFATTLRNYKLRVVRSRRRTLFMLNIN